jgi:hypothetical protein
MKISLDQIKQGIEKDPVKVLIYGDNGIGKSKFFSKAPHPLYIDLEDNLNHLPISKIKINSWGHLLELLDLLEKEEHIYKTLVIDSVDALELMIETAVCKELGVKSLTQIPYGGGRVRSNELWKYLRGRLNLLHESQKMHLCFTAHSTTRTTNEPNIEPYDRIECRINPKAQGILFDWLNCVFFAERKTILTKDQGKFNVTVKRAIQDDRVMYTDGSASFLAKNIFHLPKELPLDWSVFIDNVEEFYKSYK